MSAPKVWLAGASLAALSLLILIACDSDTKAFSPRAESLSVPLVANESEVIKRGEYLARVGDCMACHSVSGKAPFSGGLAIKSGLGTIYSTNITPDKVAGIGNYSEQQFADAIRRGIRSDGRHLYPAMPYPDYIKTKDEDVRALYVYFLKGVKASNEHAPETKLTFPFNQRWGMAFWNWVFVDDKPFTPPPGATPERLRGAYLVQSLGHCGSCHTPRSIAMNEKAFDGTDKAFLSGGDLNGWHAPSLRGIAKWPQQEIVDYLATGRNAQASVAGEMTSVVANSTSYLTATT